MTPYLNLKMRRGDTFSIVGNVTDEDGIAIDLTGKSLLFNAKRNLSDDFIYLQKIDDEILRIHEDEGIIEVVIEQEDTENLPSIGAILFWELRLDDNGVTTTLAEGSLTVSADLYFG